MNIDSIVSEIGSRFRTFGGGNDKAASWNPIAAAMNDKPLQFAAGVDVKEVVVAVLDIVARETRSEPLSPKP